MAPTDDRARDAPLELPPDKRVWATELVGALAGGRYRLEQLLEVGGMGAVFSATVVGSEDRVAVKVLLPGLLQTARSAERLRREALRARSVEHPGVVRVFEFVLDERVGPLIVMELLEGESLSDRLKRVPHFELREAVRVALDVLDILAVVHQRSILHRDLKPGNLFFARSADGRSEQLKLLDFGLARSFDAEESEATLTVPGTVVGTPRYMAPEQARADREVDHRADLYSVGALLYRLLSGQTPYADWNSREAILAVQAGPCTPLKQLAPTVPSALVAMVERAMQYEPADRYQSAAEMRDALRPTLAARPSVAPAEDETLEERVTLDSTPNALRRRRRRQRWWAPAVGLGGALTLLSGAWWAMRSAPEGPAAEASAPASARAAGDVAPPVERAAETDSGVQPDAPNPPPELDSNPAADGPIESAQDGPGSDNTAASPRGSRRRSRGRARPAAGPRAAEGRSGRLSRDEF